ncbi:MAG: ankyrin repeat domain-containing protein [Rickettsiales bacterium]
MKNKEIIAVLELENSNFKRYLIILSFIMISFVYSHKIMAQIEGLYNQNNEQFAGISNLMSAVSNNDVEGTRFFSKAGSIIVNQKNKGGATALHIASREGNLEIAKILIESGANPNLADNEGYTPLMRASLSASPEVVEYLLKNGAKPGIFNSQNETAIIHATTSKCNECINALIENGQMIKTVDTLILKGQIADSIVIANNQDNEVTQKLLYGFLDYVSKSAPLVVKSMPDEDNEPLPFRTNIPRGFSKNPVLSNKTPIQNSMSNIFEESPTIDSNPIERSEIAEKPVEIKELPITKNEIDLNKKDEIIIPVKKFTLKKEVEQTPIPAKEELAKISQPEIKNVATEVAPIKKFKFKPLDSSAPQSQEITKTKPAEVVGNAVMSQTQKQSALDNSDNNQQFEINVSKNEVKEQPKPQTPTVKKFIFKQQIDKAN